MAAAVVIFLCATSSLAFLAPTLPVPLSFGTSKSFIHTKTLRAEPSDVGSSETRETEEPPMKGKFDLATALFCGGLAFDSYTEPPSNSSRWEKGSKGMNVAFVSPAFTRSLYKGLVQVQPIEITDLPDEDDTAEGIVSGGGVDAYLLVAAIEGQWKEDVEMLENKAYHDGVMGLIGAAHVGRSRVAWSNVDEKKSIMSKKQRNMAAPYHIPSTWGKGGQAIFTEDEPPFYIYLQDPASARLVFTVMDADRMSEDTPVGSVHRRLTQLIPDAGLSNEAFVNQLKEGVLEKIRKGNIDNIDIGKNKFEVKFGPKKWEGEIKLSSKPIKKDKGGQIATGAAAGAIVAGPVGAAVGGFLGSIYEGEVRGRIKLRLRYLPFPPVEVERQKYEVKGGLPGVNWGELYERHLMRTLGLTDKKALSDVKLAGNDLEHCFFINHDETGCSCAVYRSLEKRMIVVSFRGTCAPKDILTDASLLQHAWVEGEDVSDPEVAKVHLGFRNSLSSISRRLKELVLASVAPGEDMSRYDMLVTGHSLGGALATLFVADIAEYGIDAGRALPQLEPSEPWWSSIASTFMGRKSKELGDVPPPPRPKSLRLYNFGSPRVGNDAFCERFASLQKDGFINEAYRIVNGKDVIARNPRTMVLPAVGNIGYDHCGSTVLISQPEGDEEGGDDNPLIWVEGESDNSKCPVRDSITAIESPTKKGYLLADLLEATQKSFSSDEDEEEKKSNPFEYAAKLRKAAGEVANRLNRVSGTDLASVVGISSDWTNREMDIVRSLVSGEAIAHHMEDEYYAGMGRAAGFVSRVGEPIIEADPVQVQGVFQSAEKQETVESETTEA